MSTELMQKKVLKQSAKKPIVTKGTSSNHLMDTTLMQEKKDSIKDIEKVNRLNTQYSKKPPYTGWPYKKELSTLWKAEKKNEFAGKVQGIQENDLGFSGKNSDGILGRGTAKKMLKTKEESIDNASTYSENVIHVEIDALSEDLDTSDVDSYKEQDLFRGKPLSGIHDGLKRNLKVFAIKYKRDKKKKLKINSAYRSIAHQKRLYDRNKKNNGGKPNGMVASPGGSMHQYGMAVDIGGIKSVKESLLNKYGLHRPVHKGSKSKTWEHWHVEPMGIDRKAIRTQGKKNFKKFGTAGMSKKNALGSEDKKIDLLNDNDKNIPITEDKKVDQDDLLKTQKRIENASSGMGTDEESIYSAIRETTERTALQENSQIKSLLASELSGFEYAKALLLLRYGNESSFPLYITSLWSASEGMGTDEDLIFRIMISMSPSDLSELKRNNFFLKLVKDEFSGSELKHFNDILRGNAPLIKEEHKEKIGYGKNKSGDIATKGSGDIYAFSPNDVNQGSLGNCYFLASLIATASQNPKYLENMITKSSDDSYNIALYAKVDGKFKKQVVNVTASFPSYSKGEGNEAYARGGDKNSKGNTELWVKLIEKAFAKLRKNYDEIEGGYNYDALQVIMGLNAKYNELSKIPNEKLVEKITDSFKANQPVTTATKGKSFFESLQKYDQELADKNHIVSGHAYAIIFISSSTITLRNPHGSAVDIPQPTLSLKEYRTFFSSFSLID